MADAGAFFPARRMPRSWADWLGPAVVVLGILTCWLILSLFWGSQKIEYSIGDGRIQVRAESGVFSDSIEMAVSDLAEVRPVILSGGSRSWGVGMPGFCVGRFYYEGLGNVWQATNCQDAVLALIFPKKEQTILISPEDQGRLRQVLQLHQAGRFRPAPVSPGGLWIVAQYVVLALPALFLALAGILILGPRRLGYRLSSGQLEVQLALYRRHFPLYDLTVRRQAPEVGLRILGTGVPGYYTGLFRVQGEKTRVFASSFTEGLLLEGRERIFLNPADPQAFLERLTDLGVPVLES